MALEHEALTEQIIGAAIEVHRRLGPGFLARTWKTSTSRSVAPNSRPWIGNTVYCSTSPRQRSDPSESLLLEAVPAFLPSLLRSERERLPESATDSTKTPRAENVKITPRFHQARARLSILGRASSRPGAGGDAGCGGQIVCAVYPVQIVARWSTLLIFGLWPRIPRSLCWSKCVIPPIGPLDRPRNRRKDTKGRAETKAGHR